MATSEQEIVRMLQEKISEHEQKIQSLREATLALQDVEQNATGPSKRGRKRGRKPISKNILKQASKSLSTRKRWKPKSGETFESTILNLLKNGATKTSRSLMDLYNKKTGRKLDINGFAARLSVIKKKGSVKSSKNMSDGLLYFRKA